MGTADRITKAERSNGRNKAYVRGSGARLGRRCAGLAGAHGIDVLDVPHPFEEAHGLSGSLRDMSKPAPKDAPKAYSYIRFSTPAQAKGDSQRRQNEKAARYAQEHGLVLDTELNLKDLGVSGFSGANVKTGALGAFLKAIELGAVPRGSYLLIENMDRLTRADILAATALFSHIIAAGINAARQSR